MIERSSPYWAFVLHNVLKRFIEQHTCMLCVYLCLNCLHLKLFIPYLETGVKGMMISHHWELVDPGGFEPTSSSFTGVIPVISRDYTCKITFLIPWFHGKFCSQNRQIIPGISRYLLPGCSFAIHKAKVNYNVFPKIHLCVLCRPYLIPSRTELEL